MRLARPWSSALPCSFARLLGVCLLLWTCASVPGATLEITNRANVEFQIPASGPNPLSPVPIIHSSETVSVLVELPAEPVSTDLFVEKTASRQTAEIGDFVDYVVRIRNAGSNALASITVTDLLPAGFAYMKGSTRFNGASAADPLRGGGARLRFSVGPVAAHTTVSLSYRVRVGPGTPEGPAVNSAQATTEGVNRILSNVAQASVLIGGGVFTDRAIIFGKVFLDANTNRVQDGEEPAIPGIRLYLQDGTYVVSDSEGKYSFYGLRPLLHVLKVDGTTLPQGAKLEALTTRHSTNGVMQMVELRRGEFHKADFALQPASTNLVEEIRRRRTEAARAETATDAILKTQLTPDGVPLSRGDPKGLPASGVVGGAVSGGPTSGTLTPVSPPAFPGARNDARGTNGANFQPVLPDGTLNSGNSNLPPPPEGDATLPRFEPGITNLDNSLGFVDLKDGDTLPMAQVTVRIKGDPAGKIIFAVNGQEVPLNRIGRRTTAPDNHIEITEYVGVALQPGRNQLDLRLLDSFGNQRGSNSIAVIAPDKLGVIRLLLPKGDVAADGRAVVTVGVKLEDSHGVPVTSRTSITLEASLGEWQVKDLDPREPGTQVFIEGGSGEYKLLSPIEPGDCRIRASSGALGAGGVIPFLPDLRPLIASGLLEGRMSLSSLKPGSLVPARSRDGFEEELRSFAADAGGGTFNAAGRAAFFLKGRIKGEYLLTAGFDSEKETRERLFRDIQPDEFYPVYGDSAVKGFDAQSTSRLYVRIDKKKCYLLYGDFITASQSEARALGNYSRSLTGVREHYEKDWISGNLWASYDSSRQVIEELPADGTSGPYLFRTANGIVNSEKVEILTRDRHQPSLILQSVPMNRFTDYEFEPFTGRILFKGPVASRDPNLNPISIRVTYEVDQGGNKFWVYGADGQVKPASWLELGGGAVRDENPLGTYGLYSANATVRLAPKTFVIGEVAESQTVAADGNAGRVELRHQDELTDARIYYGRAGNSFSNSASILSAGRTEAGTKVSYRIAANTRLVGQGIMTESLQNHGDRKGVRIDIEHTFASQVRLELGARYSTETDAPASASTVGVAPNKVSSLRMKATTPVPGVKGASIYGEYENDVVEPDKRLVAVGGEYQVKPKTRLYLRHEFMDALGGPFELNTFQQQNTTLIGLDTAYMKDGSLFNEYRMRDAMSGRQGEAATGLRNLWNVGEGIRLNTTFERISAVVGTDQNEATAVTGAIEYTRNPDWKGTARLELRTSHPNDSLLNTFGYAQKLHRDWTFLGRTIVYLVDNKGPGVGDKMQARIQMGLAWRQTLTNCWNALGKYEFKIENDETSPALSLHRQVHMFLGDVNYQPSADWTLSGHYGGKLAFEDSLGLDTSSDAHLLALQLRYDVSRRWDVGFGGRVLFSGIGSSTHYGFGPEVGFRIRDSVRIACGYNFFGFQDRDLSAEQYTSHGVYIALRLMFDESLLGLRKEGNQ
jgi:uncharacterized repeat protein (TIGR01451 family)